MFGTGGRTGPAVASTVALVHAVQMTHATHARPAVASTAALARVAQLANAVQAAPVAHAMACTKDTLCFQFVQGIPAAVVALTVGIVGALIAWRQYATARATLKLALFTRRYDLFMAVWDHLSHIKQLGAEVNPKNRSQNEAVTNFRNNIPQAGFLFGRDIESYLDEIDVKHVDLWELELKASQRALTSAESETKTTLEKWFDHEARTAKDRFKTYLDLRHWK